MMEKVFACIFAAFATVLCFGQVQEASEASLNITYLGDPIPQKWLARIEPMLKYEQEFYTDLGLDENFSVTIHAFRDRERGYEEMGKTAGAYGWVSQSGVKTAGVFYPSLNLIALFGLDRDMEYMVGLVAHEVSHSFFHQTFWNRKMVPMWLNEGLAEYFQHCSVNRKGIVSHYMSGVDKGRLRTKYMLGEVDLRTFLDYSRSDFMRMEHLDDMSAYRLSYALIAFFVERTPSDCFPAVFMRLKDLMANESPSCAIDAIYPGGMKALENDFRTFVFDR